jgi:hypothetical protein
MNEKPKSRGPNRRPLRLLDLMALVAAVALTLVAPAIMRAIIPAESHHNWDRRQYVIHLTALVVFWWTAMLVVLALIGSRSNLRRTCRQPGHAALFAVAGAFLFLGVQQLAMAIVMGGVIGWPSNVLNYYWVFNILEPAADVSGASVVAVWLILALTRAGRRSSNWFDRLGCVLGMIWILLGLVNHLVWWLPIPWLTTSGIGK